MGKLLLKNLVYYFAVEYGGTGKGSPQRGFEEYHQFARSGKPRCLRGLDRRKS
jgi:hypothetical protein